MRPQPGGRHHGRGGHRQPGRREEVDLEAVLPVRRRSARSSGLGRADAGVVHEDVEAPERVAGTRPRWRRPRPGRSTSTRTIAVAAGPDLGRDAARARRGQRAHSSTVGPLGGQGRGRCSRPMPRLRPVTIAARPSQSQVHAPRPYSASVDPLGVGGEELVAGGVVEAGGHLGVRRTRARRGCRACRRRGSCWRTSSGRRRTRSMAGSSHGGTRRRSSTPSGMARPDSLQTTLSPSAGQRVDAGLPEGALLVGVGAGPPGVLDHDDQLVVRRRARGRPPAAGRGGPSARTPGRAPAARGARRRRGQRSVGGAHRADASEAGRAPICRSSELDRLGHRSRSAAARR